MTKILIVNAAEKFAHSDGQFNNTLTSWTANFFKQRSNYEVTITNVCEQYIAENEVGKFVSADIIIYHTPIWWFSIPYTFKKYLDEVLTAGHKKGIYVSDGRRSANPKANYGKGGSMQSKKYMLTTSWNAPAEAFTVAGEFFDQVSVDDGVMFGFHKMNSFIGMTKLDSYHFYDVMKNPDIENSEVLYTDHLKQLFE